ncbi:MAG TPA: hypothetical protein VN451_03955 [Chitinophagaceae bacterium]|nr:hypothetical protein [Chitinophagaceae bacterium]
MKKIKPPEVKTGIWIDQESAYIIWLAGEEMFVENIKSGVESRVRIPGEGKVFARFGETYVSDEEKKQRRQQQQRKKYFKEVIAHVLHDDFLYLLGPGKAKEELNNAIEEERGFKGKVILIEAADRMSLNQMKGKVKVFFDSKEFRDKRRAYRRELKAATA